MLKVDFLLTYGSEYSIYNKQKSPDVLSFKIANNLRLSENNDLPRNSQIDEQISCFKRSYF